MRKDVLVAKKDAPKAAAKKAKKLTAEQKEALQAKAKELFDKAVEDGKVDQKDIIKVIAEKTENLEVLDKLYNDLADAGVDVTGLMSSIS